MSQPYQSYGYTTPQSAQTHAASSPEAAYQALSPHAQANQYSHLYNAEYAHLPAAKPTSGIFGAQAGSWFEFSNSGYLKGFLIGAGATLVLTNPTVQKSMVRGTVKIWSLLQGGVEEVKEQFQDIKAEMSEEK